MAITFQTLKRKYAKRQIQIAEKSGERAYFYQAKLPVSGKRVDGFQVEITDGNRVKISMWIREHGHGGYPIGPEDVWGKCKIVKFHHYASVDFANNDVTETALHLAELYLCCNADKETISADLIGYDLSPEEKQALCRVDGDDFKINVEVVDVTE